MNSLDFLKISVEERKAFSPLIAMACLLEVATVEIKRSWSQPASVLSHRCVNLLAHELQSVAPPAE